MYHITIKDLDKKVFRDYESFTKELEERNAE